MEIFPRTVMAVWRDLRICIRIILTERKRSVRSIWSSMRDMSGMRIWMDGSEHMVTTLIICMLQSWESHVNMDIQLAGLQ